MKLRNEPKELQLDIEPLEERLVPGTLTVTPPGFALGDGSVRFVSSSSPNFGLTMAHDRTGGIITWTPGT